MPLPNLERIEQDKENEESVYSWKENINAGSSVPDVLTDYVVDEQRLSQLFTTLDTGNDGFIRLEELEDYMRVHCPHLAHHAAKDIIKAGDIHKDGKLDYQEFMLYMIDHERVLWKSFKLLDKDGNGSICIDDLEEHCRENGINSFDKRAYLERIDKDGNLQIDWEEWMAFHQFSPTHSLLHDSIWYGMPGEIVRIIQDDDGKEGRKKGGVLENFVCGGVAGAASRTTTAPLDRVKVMLQVQGKEGILKHSNNLNARGVFMKIIEEGGWRSLWRGNAINCCKIMPENALRMALFELLFEWSVAQGLKDMEFWCGALTGLIVQTGMFPIELVKTRFMIQSSENRMGPYKILKSLGTTNRQRFRGCFRGLSPALVGVVPFSAIELAANRKISLWWVSKSEQKYPGFGAAGVIGTSCTISASFLTYPAKLITTRQQAYKGTEPVSSIQMFLQILKEDRYKGIIPNALWRGFIPNAIKVIPATFTSWSCFYALKNQWDKFGIDRLIKY